MNIDELTIGELKKLAKIINLESPENPHLWDIGEIYLIRTVTMIDTGKLIAVSDQELVLEDAAWIPDTGRYTDAIRKAEFNEVEPYPDGKIWIGRGAIIDAVKIKKSPRSQK